MELKLIHVLQLLVVKQKQINNNTRYIRQLMDQIDVAEWVSQELADQGSSATESLAQIEAIVAQTLAAEEAASSGPAT